MDVTQSEPITLGCQVEIVLADRAGNQEHLEVVIVPDSASDYSQGYLSENAPLARAILGEHAGSIIPYLKDDILSIEILSVAKANQQPPMDAAEQRKARMIKTVREVEDTSAIVFASSFSGKWGDYDPDSIQSQRDPEESTEDKTEQKPR
jgi:hypothetical protein